MRNGELQQLATPGDLYAHPANIFVARFVGSPPMNVIAGEVEGEVFTRPEGTLPLAGDTPSGPVTLGFRPEHATVVPAGAANALRAEVYVVEPLGPETLVTVRVGSDIVSVRAPAGFTSTIGEPCAVLPDPEQIHLFDQQSGTSLVGENATKGAVR
jgi:multiple sugar transport system ATP-binding protein